MIFSIKFVNTRFSGKNIISESREVAKYALTFQHTNAEAEKIFSMVKDVKTKKRSRISNDCFFICHVYNKIK